MAISLFGAVRRLVVVLGSVRCLSSFLWFGGGFLSFLVLSSSRFLVTFAFSLFGLLTLLFDVPMLFGFIVAVVFWADRVLFLLFVLLTRRVVFVRLGFLLTFYVIFNMIINNIVILVRVYSYFLLLYLSRNRSLVRPPLLSASRCRFSSQPQCYRALTLRPIANDCATRIDRHVADVVGSYYGFGCAI